MIAGDFGLGCLCFVLLLGLVVVDLCNCVVSTHVCLACGFLGLLLGLVFGFVVVGDGAVAVGD